MTTTVPAAAERAAAVAAAVEAAAVVAEHDGPRQAEAPRSRTPWSHTAHSQVRSPH